MTEWDEMANEVPAAVVARDPHSNSTTPLLYIK